MTGSIQTAVGSIPRVSSSFSWQDYLGTWSVRWGIGRMHYTIEPGLYALGQPDQKSPILVTANYKMSFDKLRKELPGRNFWILVLDTKGINVWCSAGKGTFGTNELVGRIESSGLSQIVSHRELILPQLLQHRFATEEHGENKSKAKIKVYDPKEEAEKCLYKNAKGEIYEPAEHIFQAMVKAAVDFKFEKKKS